jgi:hypothetical protein
VERQLTIEKVMFERLQKEIQIVERHNTHDYLFLYCTHPKFEEIEDYQEVEIPTYEYYFNSRGDLKFTNPDRPSSEPGDLNISWDTVPTGELWKVLQERKGVKSQTIRATLGPCDIICRTLIKPTKEDSDEEEKGQ